MKRFAVPVLLVLFAWGCQKEAADIVEPPTPDQPTTKAPAGSDPQCVGPIGAGTPESIKVGETEWEQNGSTLTLKSPKLESLTLGAVSDIKEDTEENRVNLKVAADVFKREKVDAIIVSGDTGEDQAQIEASLGILAAVGVPVFNIVGNREGKTEYGKAMVALRARHGNVFDLNTIRRVDTPVADIVSMPGYYNPSYIHHDDGCQYFSADVALLEKLVKSCDSPTILVSHGGPRQEGAQAIDRTAEGANVGDPGLSNLITSAQIPFGIFGNIHEAGGRATDASGKNLLKQGEMHPQLFLNPGAADGVRWPMNDGSLSVGMAAMLKVEGDKAKYTVFNLSESEDAPASPNAKPGKGKKKGKKKG
ncbi:MAG: hypothetical protein A2289_06465 [Deltaproteobacteria bacterium RIFOXYA12_FULL_58_15]|nr:MAG: hypothetical protein A2289_06465 [Deltaproteobacteria bacterium RIFOXYA12_FULL_58_15]OGR09295.1 MAG: hypothetical protein A2341_10670 [Deltaproteobacteria bacterium RIFOXYB12_FULL_58_9]